MTCSPAHSQVHRTPEQHWMGMLVEPNDWELHASIASGMLADMRLIPPYVRTFYDDMYLLLSDDVPSPVAVSAHG